VSKLCPAHTLVCPALDRVCLTPLGMGAILVARGGIAPLRTGARHCVYKAHTLVCPTHALVCPAPTLVYLTHNIVCPTHTLVCPTLDRVCLTLLGMRTHPGVSTPSLCWVGEGDAYRARKHRSAPRAQVRQFLKLPVFHKSTKTDPFAAWFVVRGTRHRT